MQFNSGHVALYKGDVAEQINVLHFFNKLSDCK